MAPQSEDISYLVVQPHDMLALTNPLLVVKRFCSCVCIQTRDIIEGNGKTEVVGCGRWWEILISVKFT